MMAMLYEFMLNHWELWSALAAIVVCLFIYEGYELRQRAQQLSPQEAVLAINHDNALVIDIRPQALFKQGHILNAYLFNKNDAPESLFKKHPDTPLILVCQRGITAQALAVQWRKAGGVHLRVLAGGMDAWQHDGYPLVTD